MIVFSRQTSRNYLKRFLKKQNFISFFNSWLEVQLKSIEIPFSSFPKNVIVLTIRVAKG